jgi:hypothetical protein
MEHIINFGWSLGIFNENTRAKVLSLLYLAIETGDFRLNLGTLQRN